MDPNLTLQRLTEGDDDAGLDLNGWLMNGGFPPAASGTTCIGQEINGYVTATAHRDGTWFVMITTLYGATVWFQAEQVTALEAPTNGDALTYTCPNCGAPRDTPCNVPTDTGRRDVLWFHSARLDLSRQEA